MQRPQDEIGISAVRGGTIVGEHEIIFAGTDEVIEFKHTAYSRAVFGKGAVHPELCPECEQHGGNHDENRPVKVKPSE